MTGVQTCASDLHLLFLIKTPLPGFTKLGNHSSLSHSLCQCQCLLLSDRLLLPSVTVTITPICGSCIPSISPIYLITFIICIIVCRCLKGICFEPVTMTDLSSFIIATTCHPHSFLHPWVLCYDPGLTKFSSPSQQPLSLHSTTHIPTPPASVTDCLPFLFLIAYFSLQTYFPTPPSYGKYRLHKHFCHIPFTSSAFYYLPVPSPVF